MTTKPMHKHPHLCFVQYCGFLKHLILFILSFFNLLMYDVSTVHMIWLLIVVSIVSFVSSTFVCMCFIAWALMPTKFLHTQYPQRYCVRRNLVSRSAHAIKHMHAKVEETKETTEITISNPIIFTSLVVAAVVSDVDVSGLNMSAFLFLLRRRLSTVVDMVRH
jgi:hypothetical protein